MKQIIIKHHRIASRVVAAAAVASLFTGVACRDAAAAPVVRTRTDTLNHDQNGTTGFSAFFTSNTNDTTTFTAESGWSPKDPAKAGAVASTTPTKTYNLVGNAVAPDWGSSGNGVPTGITLNFTVEFTITALPTSTGSFLTNPGNSGSALGNGIGITQTLGANETIAVGEGIGVSAATISNVSFTGTLSDTTFTFTPGGVSNFGTRVFRSNSFNEETGAMLLTQGAETIGFGKATGTLASNLLVNNNFGTAGAGGNPASGIFDRRVGPYTLEVTEGTSAIKGIGIAYDVTYDIAPVPVTLSGDYNLNGTVDAADYILWRKGDPAADSNGDTFVNQADYDNWRTNFGNTSPGAGVGSGTAVPEPATLILMAGCIAVCGLSRRR